MEAQAASGSPVGSQAALLHASHAWSVVVHTGGSAWELVGLKVKSVQFVARERKVCGRCISRRRQPEAPRGNPGGRPGNGAAEAWQAATLGRPGRAGGRGAAVGASENAPILQVSKWRLPGVAGPGCV